MVPQALATFAVHGFTLSAVLQLPEASGPRTLHAVELWSGVGVVARSVRHKGLKAVEFDKYRSKGKTDVAGPLSEDLLSPTGFLAAVHCVLSLVTGGLLWLAPVCSSFVYMNSARCKRSKEHPEGDEAYQPVAEGNMHAKVAAFLYALASIRNAHPVLENPGGSRIFQYKPVLLVLCTFRATTAICCRCRFSTERFGKRMRKAYKLAGSSWVADLARGCRCPDRLHHGLVHSVVRHGKKKK